MSYNFICANDDCAKVRVSDKPGKFCSVECYKAGRTKLPPSTKPGKSKFGNRYATQEERLEARRKSQRLSLSQATAAEKQKEIDRKFKERQKAAARVRPWAAPHENSELIREQRTALLMRKLRATKEKQNA